MYLVPDAGLGDSSLGARGAIIRKATDHAVNRRRPHSNRSGHSSGLMVLAFERWKDVGLNDLWAVVSLGLCHLGYIPRFTE